MATTSVTHHTVSIQQVELMLLGARARQLDVPALLERSSIPPVLLNSPLSRITQTQCAALIFTLRRTMRDELWGLCSTPLPLGSFALACRLLVRCRTLGEALDIGLSYYRMLLTDFVPRLKVQGDMVSVRLESRRPLTDSLVHAQRCFGFLAYGLVSWLVARRVPLAGVQYPHTELRRHSDASKLFQAPLRIGARTTAWHFEARWLDLPVVQNEQSLAEFFQQAPANLLVKYRDQSSVTERIRRILRRHLAEELPSLEAIGLQLAMTPQTLRRRLREEGMGFRVIKDDLRRDAAIEYLARSEMTLTEIATQLGFSEASAFHRAFKHWTGMAPGEYRQSRLHAH